MIDFQHFLQLQDLTLEDIEANRAGTVSPHQAEIAAKHRRRTTSYVLVGVGTGFVGALFVAFTFYRQDHNPIGFLAPALAVVMGGIVYAIYAAVWRFPLLTGRNVEVVEGLADRIRYLSTRDEFDVLINGVTYTGFGRVDRTFDGLRLKMYVIPDRKIVVGIEPGDQRS
jgi:sulfite exporter TauE/SafE